MLTEAWQICTDRKTASGRRRGLSRREWSVCDAQHTLHASPPHIQLTTRGSALQAASSTARCLLACLPLFTTNLSPPFKPLTSTLAITWLVPFCATTAASQLLAIEITRSPLNLTRTRLASCLWTSWGIYQTKSCKSNTLPHREISAEKTLIQNIITSKARNSCFNLRVVGAAKLRRNVELVWGRFNKKIAWNSAALL